jgi:hypothetical protein
LEEEKTTEVRGQRRWIIFVLAACVFIAIGVVGFWPGQREPECDGKTLSEWLKICGDNRAAINYSQSQSLESARVAIRRIGTNGLPWLVKWMSYDTPKWKSALLYSKFYRWLPASIRNPMVRPILQAQRARVGFDILGTAASPAIPDLVRITDRCPGQSAIYAIQAIKGCDAQPEALSALIGIATNHSKPSVIRQIAMQAIAGLHYVEKYETWVVPAILPCLDEEYMGHSTVIALGSFKISPDIGVPVMKTATGSNNADVRVWAVVSLGRYGKAASPAIPELLRALNDHDLRVQQEAADALKVVAPEMLPEGAKNF